MDYVYSKIYEAAQQVREFRHDIAKHPIDWFDLSAKRMNITPEQLKTKVLQYLDNGYVKLRIAEVYARRTEWLTSDDDGYDSFIERTDEELAEIADALHMTLDPPKPYVVNEMRDVLIQLMECMDRCGWSPEADHSMSEDDPIRKAWNRAKELLVHHEDK